MEKPLTAVTHNGKFHADDVFGAALLGTIYPKIEITRSRDPSIISGADIVFDVGGIYDHEHGRYDHHQPGALRRENGLTRSAFGLLWLHYGSRYCDGNERVVDTIDRQLVVGIDARDNGELTSFGDMRAPDYGISQRIEQLNPIVGTPETYDGQFRLAVGEAASILARMREKVEAELRDDDYVRERWAQSPDLRYVVVDRQIAPSASLSEIDSLQYLIFPEVTNGTWQVYALPMVQDQFTAKHPFPESWAGLTDEQLVHATGVNGVLFCHKKRFLVVAASREAAISIVTQSLE